MLNEYRFVQVFLIVYLGWTLLEFTMKTNRREALVPLYLMGLWYAAILISVLDYLHFPQLAPLRFNLYNVPVWVSYGFLAFFLVGSLARFGVVRTLRQQDEPATFPRTGLFALVRHPAYAAFLLQLFGVVFFFGSSSGLLVALAAGLVVLWKIPREDRIRMELYGEEYGAVIRQTKKLMPYVW